MSPQLISGNAAIARGAWEAGVIFATGYPGTPSTEVLERLAHYDEVRAQWSVNEKVAFDSGVGASLGGLRSLVAMKHMGLNVALDSFMVLPYTGVNAGFVVLVADDPSMHSSVTEQDTRFFARVAKMPMVEPSDPQEAKDLVGVALELSERFRTPVMYHYSTRIAHTKGMAELGERRERPQLKYEVSSKATSTRSLASWGSLGSTMGILATRAKKRVSCSVTELCMLGSSATNTTNPALTPV